MFDIMYDCFNTHISNLTRHYPDWIESNFISLDRGISFYSGRFSFVGIYNITSHDSSNMYH